VTQPVGSERLSVRIAHAVHATAAMKPSKETFWSWLAAIAVVGFALRAVYIFTLAAHLPGVGDHAFYYYSSNLMAQGHGYAEPFLLIFHGRYVPTALHPPLWPGLLALTSLFTGPVDGVGTLAGTAFDIHRLVGCACGAAVVVTVGLLGRRLCSWRVGLLAAALAAVYPRFVILDGYLSSHALMSALIGVVLLVAIDFNARPTRRRALAMGVVVGLAALTRQEALLFVPVLLMPLAWRARSDRKVLTLLAVSGTLLVVAPWTARNYVAFGRFVPVSNSGAVIGGANCRLTYYGPQIGSWQPACLRDVPPSSNEAVASDREQAQGVHYAERHPMRAAFVAVVRLLRAWSLFAPTDQTAGNRIVLWTGTLLYYALLIAAGYAILSRPRRWPLLILLSPAVVVSIASVLGDGPERLRYEAEVPMLVLAAWTLLLLADRCGRALHRHRHKARLLSA
jgi:4-amino-4-deoxy-L-arabinose transferase-like glycosyltransferase